MSSAILMLTLHDAPHSFPREDTTVSCFAFQCPGCLYEVYGEDVHHHDAHGRATSDAWVHAHCYTYTCRRTVAVPVSEARDMSKLCDAYRGKFKARYGRDYAGRDNAIASCSRIAAAEAISAEAMDDMVLSRMER